MANCNQLFREFNNTIKLSKTKREGLMGSRKAIRDRIRKYFRDEKANESKPRFAGQGSFESNTNINPIPKVVEKDGEEVKVYKYDLDDGVYFISENSEIERKSISTYHRWIYDAVNNHTQEDTIDKNTCVRIMFAGGHNIDLPIYFKDSETPQLAHQAKGWIDSDPKEFLDWFKEKAKDNKQLKRIIRYLKAWTDYRENCNSNRKMPSGFILTILASENQYEHERDDIAFKETLILIRSRLKSEFSCLRPTTPIDEDLLIDYSQKDDFLKELDNIIELAENALKETTQKEACKIWQKVFGDRFICSNATDTNDSNSTIAHIAAGATTSRPYYIL